MAMIWMILKLGFFRPSFFYFCISFSFSAYALPAESFDRSLNAPSNQESFDKNTDEPGRSISVDLENRLLRVMSDLVKAHQYLRDRQQQKFSAAMRNMINHVRQIDLSQERSLSYHQRLYLYRQLKDVKENMRRITMNGVSRRRQMDSLKRTYSGFIQISQAYALRSAEEKYGVYFCSKNSSVWVQNSDVKVYNPFDQTDRSCGRKIY